MRKALIGLALFLANSAWGVDVTLSAGCQGESINKVEWNAVLEGLRGDILYMDHARALSRGQEALDNASCVDAFLDVGILGDIFFYMGLAAARNEQADLASSWFSRALSAGRKTAWDEDLGEQGRDLYEQAFGLEPARAEWSWSRDAPLRIDGQLADSRELPMRLVSGWHLVQWMDLKGSVRGQIVYTTEGEDVVLTGPAALSRRKRQLWPVLPGVAVAIAGGVLMAEGYATGAKAANAQCESATMDAYMDAETSHRAAKTRAAVGAALLGFGAVGAVAGLLWSKDQRISIGPQWDRPGAVFTIRLGGSP